MRLPVVEEKKWYESGLSFRCTQCGNCCTGPPGYVWVSREEIQKLAEHLGLSEKQTLRKHVRVVGGRLSLKERRVARGQFDCEFLKDLPGGKKGCSIYPVRPLQCRTWPFWPGIVEDEQGWQTAGQTCPGLGRGRHYTPDEIENLRDATHWPDDAPGSGGGSDE